MGIHIVNRPDRVYTKKAMRILKIGGNEQSDPDFMNGLAKAIAQLTEQEAVVVVHGGGKAMVNLFDRLNIKTHKVDGLRVTNAETVWVAEMVLSGQSNKLLVRTLLQAGVNALGISGVDGGLIDAKKRLHPSADLGFVGEVVGVKTEVIEKLVGQGFVPVVSPISADSHGQPYNINADDAATAIAAALKADSLDFISNVPGVLQNGKLVKALSRKETEQLIEDEIITDGMIPKVRAATAAVQQGVVRARIVNLAGFADGGTVFHKEQ